MTLLSQTLTVFTLLTCALAAQNKPAEGLPPLIDRELLFGNPEISGAQISPDGKFLAFIKPYKDTRNVWVKKPRAVHRRAPARPPKPSGPSPASSGARRQVRRLREGQRRRRKLQPVYAVDPAASAGRRRRRPALPRPHRAQGRPGAALSPRPRATRMSTSASTTATRPGTTSTGRNLHRRADAGPQEHRDRIAGLDLRRAGPAAAGDAPTTTATRRPAARGRRRLHQGSTPATSSRPAARSASTRTASASTGEPTRARSTCYRAAVLFDVATGKMEIVESDPLKRVDFGGASFSEVTDELAMTSYTDETHAALLQGQDLRSRLQVAAIEAAGQGDRPRLAHARTSSCGWSPRQRHRARRDLPVRPQERRRSRCSTASARSCRANALSPMTGHPLQVIRRPGDSRLTSRCPRAAGEEPAAHRGPARRSVGARRWGYNPMAQFLANRGYAVLMPNFRGSTGYGKKFLNAGNGEWGGEDAGRPHLGRQVPGRRGHRRSEARRHPGRFLRRLRDAGRVWRSRRTCTARPSTSSARRT